MIRHPSSVIIAGPSGSGKTELVEQWLRDQNLFQVKPKKIVYAYDRWQHRCERMQKQDGVQFHRWLPDPRQLTQWFGRTRVKVLVLDDLMEEGGQDKRVLDLFTKHSHHRNITVLYLRQDLFPPGQIFQDHQLQCPLHRGVQEPLRSNGDTHHFTTSLSRLMASSLAPI